MTADLAQAGTGQCRKAVTLILKTSC